MSTETREKEFFYQNKNLLRGCRLHRNQRVYNYETNTVEESIHIKFDDKEPGNKMSELVEIFAEIQITEDGIKPEQPSELVVASDGSEAGVTSEAHPDNCSGEATLSKRTFK